MAGGCTILSEKHSTVPAFQLSELHTYDIMRYYSPFEKSVADNEVVEIDGVYHRVLELTKKPHVYSLFIF